MARMGSMTVSLPERQKRELTSLSALLGVPRAMVVRLAIKYLKEYLEERKGPFVDSPKEVPHAKEQI